MSLVMQPRDLEILAALAEWGALSLTQIATRWFTCPKKARARMAALAAAGHCRRRQPARDWPTVFYAGERWRESLLHQVEVNEVRLRLMAAGELLDFVTEVEFRGTKHRADALVKWRARPDLPPLHMFLEVDRGTENRVQIREKVQAYVDFWRSGRWRRLWPEFVPVVFVSGAARARQLAQWVRAIGAPEAVRFHFSLEEVGTVCSHGF